MKSSERDVWSAVVGFLEVLEVLVVRGLCALVLFGVWEDPACKDRFRLGDAIPLQSPIAPRPGALSTEAGSGWAGDAWWTGKHQSTREDREGKPNRKAIHLEILEMSFAEICCPRASLVAGCPR